MDSIGKIFRGDRVIWTIFLFLCAISIIEVYSASSTLTFHTDYWRPIAKHIMFVFLGIGVVLITQNIHPRYYILLGIIFPFVVILLIMARFFAVPINGSSRWIDIDGVSFQPSEIAKLSLIVLTAFFLSKKKLNNEIKIFYLILTFMVIGCVSISLDSGSTSILLACTICLMLLIGQVYFKRMFLLIIISIISCYSLIKYTPSDFLGKIFPRIMTWESRVVDYKNKIKVNDPHFVINDENYQIAHASIAISNGRIFGRGPGNSIERDFLPQAYSDFIYAVIIEETGLVGGFCILFLYLVLLFRIGIIANRSNKLFSKFMVIGIGLCLIIQTLANMAVAVNLIPITGQTLPLISRGGTSMLVTCVYFGIILSVSRYETGQGLKNESEYLIRNVKN